MTTPPRPSSLSPDGAPLSAADDSDSMSINERKLNEFLESSPDAILIVNQFGLIERINRQSEELFGYSRRELTGDSVDRLIPIRFRDSHRHHVLRYQGSPAKREMGAGLELFCTNKQEQEIPVQISLSPIRVGNEITTMVRIRDITEQVAQDEALRKAKEEAEQANRAKSRFLAAASHDLRQPLQSISMYLGVLGGQIGEAEKTRIIGQTKVSLDTINNLLNSLLDISKLESGSVQPNIQKFPIADVLKRVYNTGLPIAEEKQQRFNYLPCSSEVECDAALLEQLFINLMSNAVRYTMSGGHVVLGCRRRGDLLEIQLLDNGIGIPQDEIGNIFNEYVQLEYHGQRSSKGLGLGLAIVKRIADLLNLRYEVRSELNRGTCFSIFVPVIQRSSKKTVETRQQIPAKPEKTLTILLVEDDLAVLQSTALFLEVSGLKVMQAKNLLQALQLIGNTRPDLIISDYGLRNKENGIQVVDAVRKMLGTEVKALILTGDTSGERAREAAAAGCDIIYKPIKSDSLLDWIYRLSNNTNDN